VTLATTKGNGSPTSCAPDITGFNQPQLPLNNGTPLQIPNMGFEKTFLDYVISPFDTIGSGSQFKRAVNVYNYIDNASQSMVTIN